MKHLLWIFLILIFSTKIDAQNLDGYWGYRINGKKITLYGDKIENLNSGGSSGTLKVALYASDYPYNGGTLNGYKLYEITLDPLSGGYYYDDISKTGYCSYPPSGSYYMTIVLLEYNYNYEIIDYISLDGYTRF